jgi:antitoxin ParD1/3/4
MASMNVSVPDRMRDWVQSRIDSGQYASVSDYVRDLIRRDQALTLERQRGLAALDASIARGLADADADRVRDLDDVCDEMDERYARLAAAREAM